MQDAIICDIDGTIANHMDRGIHDYHLVYEDELHETIARIVRTLALSWSVPIIYITGRPESCRQETVDWLVKHDLPTGFGNPLYMRETGDRTADTIIKRDIYLEHIKPHYNVLFVLEDRKRVVQMWRNEGLICLQVAEGNF